LATLIGRWVLYVWGKAKEDVVEDVSSHETPTTQIFLKLNFVLKLVVKPYTQTW